MHNGDHNGSFFHNTVCSHNHFNAISHIFDSNGEDVVNAFTSFYNNLWSDPGSLGFVYTVNALPDDLPFLPRQDCDLLTRIISNNEVYEALLSLPSGKSPSPDGLTKYVVFIPTIW